MKRSILLKKIQANLLARGWAKKPTRRIIDSSKQIPNFAFHPEAAKIIGQSNKLEQILSCLRPTTLNGPQARKLLAPLGIEVVKAKSSQPGQEQLFGLVITIEQTILEDGPIAVIYQGKSSLLKPLAQKNQVALKKDPSTKLLSKAVKVAFAASFGLHTTAVLAPITEEMMHLVSTFGFAAITSILPLLLICKIIQQHLEPLDPAIQRAREKEIAKQKQKVIKQATDALVTLKEEGESTLNWKTFTHRAEYLAGKKVDYNKMEKGFERRDKKLTKLARKAKKIAAKAGHDPIKRFQAVYDYIYYYSTRYYVYQSSLYRLLDWGGMGNCEARAKLHLALLEDIYDWENCDWKPVILLYEDHGEIGLFNQKTGQIYDATEEQIVDNHETPIFHPLIFAHAHLQTIGGKSPLSEEDLLIKMASPNEKEELEEESSQQKRTDNLKARVQNAFNVKPTAFDVKSPMAQYASGGYDAMQRLPEVVPNYLGKVFNKIKESSDLPIFYKVWSAFVLSSTIFMAGYLGLSVYTDLKDRYDHLENFEDVCDAAESHLGEPVPAVFYRTNNNSWYVTNCPPSLIDTFRSRETIAGAFLRKLTNELEATRPKAQAATKALDELDPEGLISYPQTYSVHDKIFRAYLKANIFLVFSEPPSKAFLKRTAERHYASRLIQRYGSRVDIEETSTLAEAFVPYEELFRARRNNWRKSFSTAKGINNLNTLPPDGYAKVMGVLSLRERIIALHRLDRIFFWGHKFVNRSKTNGDIESDNLQAHDRQTIRGEDGEDYITQKGSASELFELENEGQEIAIGQSQRNLSRNKESTEIGSLEPQTSLIKLPEATLSWRTPVEIFFMPAKLIQSSVSPRQNLLQKSTEQPPPFVAGAEFAAKTYLAVSEVEQDSVAMTWSILARALMSYNGRKVLIAAGQNINHLEREVQTGGPGIPTLRSNVVTKFSRLFIQTRTLIPDFDMPSGPLAEFNLLSNVKLNYSHRVCVGRHARFESEEITPDFVRALAQQSSGQQIIAMRRLTDLAIARLRWQLNQGISGINHEQLAQLNLLLEEFTPPEKRILSRIRAMAINCEKNRPNSYINAQWGKMALNREFSSSFNQTGTFSFPNTRKNLWIGESDWYDYGRTATVLRNQTGKISGFLTPYRTEQGKILLLAFNLLGKRAVIIDETHTPSQAKILIETNTGEKLTAPNPRVNSDQDLLWSMWIAGYDSEGIPFYSSEVYYRRVVR